MPGKERFAVVAMLGPPMRTIMIHKRLCVTIKETKREIRTASSISTFPSKQEDSQRCTVVLGTGSRSQVAAIELRDWLSFKLGLLFKLCTFSKRENSSGVSQQQCVLWRVCPFLFNSCRAEHDPALAVDTCHELLLASPSP